MSATTTKAQTAGHTPGPWTYDEVGQIYAADGTLIAELIGDIGQADINGLFVASAPETAAERDRLKEINAELLEALEAFANEFHGEDGFDRAMNYGLDAILVEARAAISRATVTP